MSMVKPGRWENKALAEFLFFEVFYDACVVESFLHHIRDTDSM